MTEYWKSNARKYCEFCKCWIADNKISVSLHEDGKRHKDNVAKKISIITKKSAKDHKAQVRIDAEMAKMEKVAMAAYLNDIKNNADLTSQLINQKLAGVNRVDAVRKDVKVDTGNTSYAYGYGEQKKTTWQEAKAEGGHTYYWNTETNEACWEIPNDGFIPLSELTVKMTTPNSKPRNIPKPPKKGKKNKGQKNQNHSAVIAKKELPPTYYGPQPSNPNPYGKWTTVKTISPGDLQLPEQKVAPVVTPVIIAPPVEKVFKQKEMKQLEDDFSADSGFKKRKINCNAKRNTRQRLDDD